MLCVCRAFCRTYNKRLQQSCSLSVSLKSTRAGSKSLFESSRLTARAYVRTALTAPALVYGSKLTLLACIIGR